MARLRSRPPQCTGGIVFAVIADKIGSNTYFFGCFLAGCHHLVKEEENVMGRLETGKSWRLGETGAAKEDEGELMLTGLSLFHNVQCLNDHD